jgi:putative PIN family toxin of toxin-antitoxin system
VRVFFDTNVLVAALLARGLCADLFALSVVEHEVMTGEFNLAELRRTLCDKRGMHTTRLEAIDALLREHTVVPMPAHPHALEIRDPDDAWVLASAVAGGAELLVTGDHDLLDVAHRAPLPVVNPRDAWERLRRG